MSWENLFKWLSICCFNFIKGNFYIANFMSCLFKFRRYNFVCFYHIKSKSD